VTKSPADPPTAPKGALLTVFLVVFIDLLGFGIVLPLLPRYAKDYLDGFSPTAVGVVIGLLFSSFSLMQFLFSPVWGRISDRIGRRPVLLVSLSGSVVFYALFGVAAALPPEQSTLALVLLFISRVGAGIAGASVSTAAAVIADCTTPEKRSKGMALIGAAFGIGFTFGPLIAYVGLTVFQNERWGPGAIASLLSAAALVIAYTKMPETRKAGGTLRRREIFNFQRTIEVLKSPALGPLVLVYFLVIFAFANFEGTLSLFTGDVLKMNDQSNCFLFAYVGFALVVAQGGFYRRLAGKIHEFRLMTAGVAMMFLGLGGLGGLAFAAHQMTGSPDAIGGLKPVFYLTIAVSVFGFAFVNPSVSSLVSKRADPARQGEVQGVSQSFASLGRILGPFLGIVLYQASVSRILPYAAAGATLLLVVILLPLVKQSEGKTMEAAIGAGVSA
jgi:MFS transporter, DHA1 family, tetracycline resistance protein